MGSVDERGGLTVVSAETVPLAVVLTPEVATSGVLDLQLSTGWTLRLTLLDRDDDHPLAGEDFLLTLSSRSGPMDSVSGTRAHAHG